MKDKPFVGQKVRINDQGLRQIGGLRSAEEIRQSQNMTITYVSENMCDDVETYNITVDQPLMRFFLMNHDVDPV